MRRSAIRAGVWTLAVVAAPACGGPPLDGRAVWTHELEDGRRAVTVYDHGEFWHDTLQARPAATEPLPHVTLGPAGRHLLERAGASTPESGRVIDLEQGRAYTLRVPGLRFAVDDPVQFSPRGDALMWIDRQCTGGRCTPWSVWVVPMPGDEALPDVDVLEALSVPGVEPSATLLPAARAPAVFSVAKGSAGAYRWDADASTQVAPQGSRGNAIARVGGFTSEHDLRVDQAPRCPFPDWCGVSSVATPDGRALFSISEDCPFGLGRWRPREDEALMCLSLPNELEGTLLHAFDSRRIVVASDTLLRVVDVETGFTRAAPILGDGPFEWRVVDEGAVVVFTSATGPFLRADAEHLTRVSVGTTECLEPRGFVVAPAGRWVAWACGHVPELAEDTGQVVSALIRVSSEGLERFPGTPSDPIAIDDDGDLLLATVEGTRERLPQLTPLIPTIPGRGLRRPVATGAVEALPPDPLTLYTLDATGTLRRVHDLEPTPRAVSTRRVGESRFIMGAAAPRRSGD